MPEVDVSVTQVLVNSLVMDGVPSDCTVQLKYFFIQNSATDVFPFHTTLPLWLPLCYCVEITSYITIQPYLPDLQNNRPSPTLHSPSASLLSPGHPIYHGSQVFYLLCPSSIMHFHNILVP